MKLEIIRFSENSRQTLSKFIVFDDYNCELAQGFMLELPDNNNERRISRINEGEYDCIKRNSKKYDNHFHVLNVVDRSYILIHKGNYNRDTKGCILPGSGLIDIDGDGLLDVVSSVPTMKMLNRILPNKFKLVIKNQIL
tara:strand:+ start:3283 stop:3699 length:417 start_codon:yes stop_codon:yes gene_type:complete